MKSISEHSNFPLIIVSGRSGAGKSTVLQVFEDMGYFKMEGLPVEILLDVLNVLNPKTLATHKGLILSLDLTQDNFLAVLNKNLLGAVELGFKTFMLYIEASRDALLRRYATTRRPHPLEREGHNLEQAIDAEEVRLAALREMADSIIDTSSYSIHDLRRFLQKEWNDKTKGNAPILRVHVISFGFKYGLPAEAEMAFDLRCIPNPYFVPELKELTGKDAPVVDYIFKSREADIYYKKLEEFLLTTLPIFETEGRYRVSLAIGCTGGKHRSVAFAEAISKTLEKSGYNVTLEHRHMELG